MFLRKDVDRNGSAAMLSAKSSVGIAIGLSVSIARQKELMFIASHKS